MDFDFASYEKFGFEPRLEISTRPEKRIGTEDSGIAPRRRCSARSTNHDLPFELNEGDGAFYGPKIDFKMRTRSVASGSWARSSWTTSCPSASISPTPARTTKSIGR